MKTLKPKPVNTCISCRWIEYETMQTGQKKTFCLRFPPSVFPISRSNPLTGKVENGFLMVRPEVGEGERCGEWEEEILE